MGNWEPKTGVWERVYRGNPDEKSKWLTKPSTVELRLSGLFD